MESARVVVVTMVESRESCVSALVARWCSALSRDKKRPRMESALVVAVTIVAVRVVLVTLVPKLEFSSV